MHFLKCIIQQQENVTTWKNPNEVINVHKYAEASVAISSKWCFGYFICS